MLAKTVKFIFCATLLFCSVGFASGTKTKYFITGEYLLPKCHAAIRLLNKDNIQSGDGVNATVCSTFVMTSMDAYNQFLSDSAKNNTDYIKKANRLPSNLFVLIRMFTKYLDEHPEQLQYSAYQTFFVFCTSLEMHATKKNN
ncbi:MAG: hypothetical protein PVI75_01495 [Gammaproteobacteria bacterium]|jgi:hypothetical protein